MFPAKAKSVIYLFMAGAPSHLDMLDYKPKLQHVQPWLNLFPRFQSERPAFCLHRRECRRQLSAHALRLNRSGKMRRGGYLELLPHLQGIADVMWRRL